MQFAVALLLAVSVALGALGWRLAQGPLELAWLAQRLEAAANADGQARLSLGRTVLAWEGFSHGLDRPLDIRIDDIAVSDSSGQRLATIPRAAVSLSPGWLLLGRIVPRAIEVDGAQIHAERAADGGIKLDLDQGTETGAAPPDQANLPALLRELSQRPRNDQSPGLPGRWSQLRRVHIRGTVVTVKDDVLGVTWSVPALDLDLRRPAAGGIVGRAKATLALSGVGIDVAVDAQLAQDGRATQLAARLAPFVPAALARALPATVPWAAPLAALDAPVRLEATAALGPDLAPEQFTAAADLGTGSVHLGSGSAPVLEARMSAQGTPDRIALRLERLVAAPRPDGPRSTLTGHAEAARGDGGTVAITAALDLDRAAFADLPALWPEGVGGPGTRPWITANITDGIAHDGHIELALEVPADFSDARLSRIAGGVTGSDLTVHWLRPVPPIVHGEAKLAFLDPDRLEVTATAGVQSGGQTGGIAIRGGRVLFSGISAKEQFADIEADLAGPVPDALTLLSHPRLRLLQRSPLKLRGAAGQCAGHLTVTRLPLRDEVAMDDLNIRTDLRLTGLRLAGIAAGRDLERGNLDLKADADGAQIAGDAVLAGISARLQAEMDFRAGPPSQIQQSATVSATLDPPALATLGLGKQDVLTGPMQVVARLAERRDQRAEAIMTADLRQASVRVAPLSYTKPPGQPATAQARIVLDRDRIVAIDTFHAEADALRLDGSAEFRDGKPSLLRLDRLHIGAATDASGRVQVPLQPGDPWRATLAGHSLDASALLKRDPSAPPEGRSPPPEPGPPYAVDARFDQVMLGPGRVVSGIVARAESDGTVMRRLSFTGRTADNEPFQLSIEPEGRAERRLTGTAADAGGLLRALDVVGTMQGGRLTLNGRYDDRMAEHPLSGTAEIADFRVRNAPALAKLLQAMTLYGLVEAVQGPGLGFRRLVAPFQLKNDVLELSDARAFSASLGMTAKGRVDLARQEFDMQGTIVPAYFFNTLLGDLPLVGRLFSPERGGGVFAATYTLRGPMDDPRVAVNPLAALTPGFLRGLFGMFDGPDASR